MKRHIERLRVIQELITGCERRAAWYEREANINIYPDGLRQSCDKRAVLYRRATFRLYGMMKREARILNNRLSEPLITWMFVINGKEVPIRSEKAAKRLAAAEPDAMVSLYDEDGLICQEVAGDIWPAEYKEPTKTK